MVMMAVLVCMMPVYLILYTLFLIFLMDIDLMDDIYKYIYFNPSFLLNVYYTRAGWSGVGYVMPFSKCYFVERKWKMFGWKFI